MHWRIWASATAAAFSVAAIAFLLASAHPAVGRDIPEGRGASSAAEHQETAEIPASPATPTPETRSFLPQEKRDDLGQETAPGCTPTSAPTPTPTSGPAQKAQTEASINQAEAPTPTGIADATAFKLCPDADNESIAHEVERIVSGRNFAISLVTLGDGCAQLTVTPKSNQTSTSGRSTTITSVSVTGKRGQQMLTVEVTTESGVASAKIYSSPSGTATPPPELKKQMEEFKKEWKKFQDEFFAR